MGLGQDVRINQRFFAGGKEVRGFANAGFGPRDTATSDALGGNSYYAATGELRFPLGLPEDLGITGATFVDAGSAWALIIPARALKAAATCALRLASALPGAHRLAPYALILLNLSSNNRTMKPS